MKLLLHRITLRHVATFILILFCTQYVPLETYASVSFVKLAVSLLCPFIIFAKSPWISRPIYLFTLYYFLVLAAALSHPETLRWSTVLFALTFMFTYIAYYNLITINQVFTKEFFVKLLRRLIKAFAIMLLIQHCLMLVGIEVFPLLNMTKSLERGIAGSSLLAEPAHTAVIMSFAFLSLLRMYQLEKGSKLSFSEVWAKDKWVVISFFYTMIGIVSGTAMAGLALLSLYFIKPKQLVVALPVVVLLIYLLFNIDFLPLQRARDSFLAFLTLDRQAVMAADGSSAARIIPIVNTLTRLDLTTLEGWFGHGVDYGFSELHFSEKVMIGGIADYGFLSFLVMQVAVYSCMIRKFFSLETLYWMFLCMMTLANFPLHWGAMMLFTTVRYFQTNGYKD